MAQNELKRLLPRHYEIMRMCLSGLRAKDIATALKPPMTPIGVSLVINSPLFQDGLAREREGQFKADSVARTEDAMDILEEAASDAANKHVALLDSKNERIAQASANAILDRVLSKEDAGLGIVKLDPAVVNILQITINELKEAAVESNVPEIERKDIDLK